jgi:hypothetical protein
MQIKKKIKTNNLNPVTASQTGPVLNVTGSTVTATATPVSSAVPPVTASTATDVTELSNSVVGQKRNLESNV